MNASTSSPARRARALFLIHDLKPGGAERVFLTYVQSLQRIHALPVLVRREIELQGIDPAAVLDLGPPDHSHRPITRSEIPKSAFALARKAWRLHRLTRTHDARLVSTFLHKSHIVALTAKLFLNPRLRVVLNVHEQLSHHLEHHFRPEQQPIMRWFTRRYFPRADAIVAVSEGVKRDLIESFGIVPHRITVVPNPLDLNHIRQRAREPINQDVPPRTVIAVGRLVKLKGFDVLLDAFARLPAELDSRLLILGDGAEHGRLVALAAQLGITEQARFLGYQDNPWKYMAHADVLALSSRTEAFPNAIGEALTLGLPVVATDCSPGVRDYLENGRAGLLVPSGDPAALAEALKRVLEDHALRDRLKARGTERVQAFALTRVVPVYESLLESVLHGARQITPSTVSRAPRSDGASATE
jgi:glycosyltransferase involved in cell wall biosynthesis